MCFGYLIVVPENPELHKLLSHVCEPLIRIITCGNKKCQSLESCQWNHVFYWSFFVGGGDFSEPIVATPFAPKSWLLFFWNPHLHFGFRNYTLVSFAHIFRCSNWIFIQTLWIHTWGEVPVPSTRAQAIVSNDQKFFKIPKFRGLEITRSASFASTTTLSWIIWAGGMWSKCHFSGGQLKNLYKVDPIGLLILVHRVGHDSKEVSYIDARFEGNEGCLIVSQSFPGEEPIASQTHAHIFHVWICFYFTSCTNNNKDYL